MPENSQRCVQAYNLRAGDRNVMIRLNSKEQIRSEKSDAVNAINTYNTAPMTEFDLAWIRRRTRTLIERDIMPAAAKMIAIQEALKRRQCRPPAVE